MEKDVLLDVGSCGDPSLSGVSDNRDKGPVDITIKSGETISKGQGAPSGKQVPGVNAPEATTMLSPAAKPAGNRGA